MGASFVQDGSNSTGGASSVAVVLSSAVAAGDLIVVCVGYGGTGTLSVADTLGTSYNSVASVVPQTSYLAQMFYGIAAESAGSATVTVSNTESGALDAWAGEYTGGSFTADNEATNNGQSGSASVGMPTLTNPPELVIAMVYNPDAIGTITGPGGSWTERENDNVLAVEEWATASGATGPTWSLTNSLAEWGAIAGSFYIGGSSGGQSGLSGMSGMSGLSGGGGGT